MKFTYKTPAEVEALSEYQREKYLDEKVQFEKSESKRMADEAVAEALKTVDSKIEDAVNKAKDEAKVTTDQLLKDKQAEADAKFQEMEKQIKNSGGAYSRSERAKTMGDYIEAKLSTDEGEAMLKAFIAGQRKEFNTEVEDAEKAVFLTPTGGVPVDYLGVLSNSYGRVHMRNLMPVYPTLSNMITFLRLVQDPTADGIQQTAEGALKGELKYTPTEVKVPVVKLAGYVNLSEEAFDDVVGLRAWLARELPNAYLKVEDEYILLDPTYGIYPLATAWVADGAINAWDTLISALAQLETADQYGTAILVSPAGKKELRRNKDLINGLYTYPMISFDNGILRFDGIPVYSTNSLTGLQFLVGDFAEGVELRQRKGMNVRYSTENEDNFVKNVITVLIEGRVAVCVKRPQAFVKGSMVVSAPVAPTP